MMVSYAMAHLKMDMLLTETSLQNQQTTNAFKNIFNQLIRRSTPDTPNLILVVG